MYHDHRRLEDSDPRFVLDLLISVFGAILLIAISWIGHFFL